jgi:Na+/proline symporter
MLGFGYLGSRRVRDADDFATARRGYGPLVLALAFSSTAASGATFLGLPGLTYTYGMSTLWIAFCYPLGVYIGVLICQRTIARYGDETGARSMPEYLGERLGAQDPALLATFNPANNTTASLWAAFNVTVAHIPLGLLPHIGNKLWALKDERARIRFIAMAFTFGLILPAITLGGMTARAVLGDSLFETSSGANSALPALFIQILPTCSEPQVYLSQQAFSTVHTELATEDESIHVKGAVKASSGAWLSGYRQIAAPGRGGGSVDLKGRVLTLLRIAGDSECLRRMFVESALVLG